MTFIPSYIKLYESGKLQELVELFKAKYKNCNICPHSCNINRFESDKGVCQTGAKAYVSSASSHFGEEKPLVGKGGSGTIFFTGCNMKCLFCQNHEISQLMYGTEIPAEELADIMLKLQNQGCHNINFVTPTHMILQILEALKIAVEKGLCIPLVYNNNGYSSLETLQGIEGIFDIYMPDIKYSSNKTAKHLSKVNNYVEISKKAVLEMHRQVGDLTIDENGIAFNGLIVRHLVIPGYIGESEKIIDFVASISENTYFNLMDQYVPYYQAFKTEALNRTISKGEYRKLKEYAQNSGLLRLSF